jgi:ATP-dependent Clp protease ATP-binding subunit ClpA
MPFVNELIDHNRAQAEQAAGTVRPEAKESRFLFDPAEVMTLLRSRIVGQPEALDAVEAMLKVVKTGVGDPGRPLAVNLFIGPTGVGKTEIVRLLAQAVHGKPDAFCRIDMNTLAQEHYAAALTGAPPGYVGSKEGTTLFDIEAIQGSFSRPGIVLFDELEKASREVVRSLLNVLDSGRLTLAAGTRQIDFRNSLIFMTSNIGAQEAWQAQTRHERGWRRWLGIRSADEAMILNDALHRHFEPEFLNRIDRILRFEPIGERWLNALLDIEMAKLQQRLARQGRSLSLAPAARTQLCAGHDPRYGARDLARRLRISLEPALADALLREPTAAAFTADVAGDRLLVCANPA